MLFLWNSWKTIEMSLLVHLIRGIAWSFTSTPVTVGQGMVDPSERLPKAVALQACVCVCAVLVTKKNSCHWRPKQHTRGINRDHEGSRVSEGLRQLYTFFAAWCDALGKRFIDLRPTLRCGVVSKEIKATRKSYLAEGVSQVILIFFQLRWEISTVVDPCVRTQTGHP